MKKNRDITVDTLRGIACLLLVSFHVIGSNSSNGLHISDGIYREISDLLIFIRMPLFTFLSGYIYAYRPFSSDSKKYVKGKASRLLMPMLTVGTAFAIIQLLMPGSNQSINEWYLIHIIPVGHFWFLESVFLIFILMIPLEKYQLLSTKFNFFIVFCFVTLLYLSSIELKYFAISGFIYLLPFFLFGVAVRRFDLSSFVNFKIIWLMLGVVISLVITIYMDLIVIESKRTILPLLMGCVSCFVLLNCRFKSELLAKIGIYSYSIYLFHVFFTAGSRIILSKFGVSDINLLFICSLFLGVSGAILTELIFDKYKITRLSLLGKSR